MSPLLHPSIDGDRVAQFRSILFPELIYLKITYIKPQDTREREKRSVKL